MPLKNSFTFLVHGDAGVGKSRLAASAPRPELIIDLEGRARYLPGKKVWWNVQVDPPPEPGDWELCILQTTKFSDLQLAYRWLASGKHCFKSVAVDSLTFAQKRFIADIVGVNQMQQQDWGEVLRNLEQIVRDFCDLTQLQNNTVEVVAFTVGTKDTDNKRAPLLQGALRDSAAYLYDAVGYLYLAPDQTGAQVRSLLVEPQAGIVAKDGTDMLGGPIIPNPNLTEMTARLSEENN